MSRKKLPKRRLKRRERPPDPQTELERAFGLHCRGKIAEAELIYSRLFELGRPSAILAHLRGRTAVELGNLDFALELLTLATRLDSASDEAFNDLGNVLQELGRPDEACAAYRRAVEINPHSDMACKNLGLVLKELGRSEEAREVFQQAIRSQPNDAKTYFHLGLLFRDQGDLKQAAAMFEDAIRLRPEMPDAHQALCAVLRQDGRDMDLEQAFQHWIQCDPDNPVAAHMAAAMKGMQVPSRASDGYVQSVFDEFAATFDQHLAELEYHLPERIGELLSRVYQDRSQNLTVLDAGCGTGLCGVILRPWARCLDGVDLSSRMIEQAKEKLIYDHLVKAELGEFLAERLSQYDLIIAADTLNYFGDLLPVLLAAHAALKTDGRLLFSLESHPAAGEPFRLNPNGRYSHSPGHVLKLLQASGYELEASNEVILRQEAHAPVLGLLILVRRSSNSALTVEMR
ncbi:tetratricopeptide repeat protein [Novipirellula artificiosorum]|uniref:Mg-protoporphyrin IX methyl transferase n=1 Tax=Novipirellula artificiosorum TaxID=2528016 RepID=A0A5C6D924_9BACT|nr:tetratricopeptide repeat protein [Novipirellula artificiosorum]TWU32635.1 Mg-protoporphyrin IX methyl transferase [Novipirellula artificiosorum]